MKRQIKLLTIPYRVKCYSTFSPWLFRAVEELSNEVVIESGDEYWACKCINYFTDERSTLLFNSEYIGFFPNENDEHSLGTRFRICKDTFPSDLPLFDYISVEIIR